MNVNVASCQHTGGAESSVPELRKYKGQERLHRRKELNLAIGGRRISQQKHQERAHPVFRSTCKEHGSRHSIFTTKKKLNRLKNQLLLDP